MPDPGATDPADLQARACAQLGLTWQLKQTLRKMPHPCCRGRGYNTWFCQEQCAKAAAGKAVDVTEASILRWRERLHPYRPTGNKAREQVVGVDLINLVTFLKAWPEAHLNEIAIFIYNKGGLLYPITDISKCLDKLKITKKRASTEEYQVQKEEVQFRVWSYWNCPSPLGIFGVPQCKLIDVDKFGISLEKCNCTGGWAMRVFRVRKDWHYHHGAKITVLLAIEPGDPALLPHVRGSVQHPQHWIWYIHEVGTRINIFRDFCDHICLEIEQFGVVGTDDHRILIWDNLAAHHSVYVPQTVTGCEGPCQISIVAWLQYHPKFGPIEYKICE
jgi:hypothetical protein